MEAEFIRPPANRQVFINECCELEKEVMQLEDGAESIVAVDPVIPEDPVDADADELFGAGSPRGDSESECFAAAADAAAAEEESEGVEALVRCAANGRCVGG